MWLATRARVTGSSHVVDMLPCQDFAEKQITDEYMICVVSDGASSAPFGEIGASIAVESIKRYFKDTSVDKLRSMSKQELNGKILNYFRAYLDRKIQEIKFSTNPSDYAATVAFIVICEKDDFYLCGVVGDCAIAKYSLQGIVLTISDTISGKEMPYDIYRPHFITDDLTSIQFSDGRLSECSGFIITTDGCANGGLLSFEKQFDLNIINAIFKSLPVTQNPEIWLEKFICRNIAEFTSDDLSMYVIYSDTNQSLNYTSKTPLKKQRSDGILSVSQNLKKGIKKKNNKKQKCSYRRTKGKESRIASKIKNYRRGFWCSMYVKTKNVINMIRKK